MNALKQYVQIFKRAVLKKANLSDPLNKTIATYNKMVTYYKIKKWSRKTAIPSIEDDRLEKKNQTKVHRFVREFFEIFGLTAVMSITVLSILGVLGLSFVTTSFLESYRGYGELTLSLSLVLIGIGWYFPFKIRNLLLMIVGAFLFFVTFGPMVIEGYTSQALSDVSWKNGYWDTVKATAVFICYLLACVSMIVWIFLVTKGQCQNPLKRIRIMKLNKGNE